MENLKSIISGNNWCFMITNNCVFKYLKQFIFINLILLSSNIFAQNKTTIRNTYPRIPIKRIVDSLKLDSNAIEIKITKSKYLLEVIYNNQVVKTYPCVFGYGYPKDKLMKGDKATPEGRFLVNAFYLDISWSMFISLNFPNKASLEKIHKAKQQKIIPANARTGGSIGIHGTNPDSDHLIDQKYNWTHGCISLKRADIIDLCTILKKYGNVVSIVK